jgi:RNA polymerase sigma factor (sigma-70 family)
VSLETLVKHIRMLAGTESVGPKRDRELLHHFAETRDEGAFAELVERHGALVQGVCERVLGHNQDAEDAFQATFLVLARKAADIHNGESLGSWLHGVAYRVASKARATNAVRHRHERQAGRAESVTRSDELTWQEVRQVLDDELSRMPAKYREPLLRCYLEGKTKDEAAQELGWSVGVFRGRLDRARERLRRRLIGRGITLSSVLSAAALAQSVGRASVPAACRQAAIKAAVGFTAGAAGLQGASPNVKVLADAALSGMGWTRSKVVAVAGLVLGFAAVVGGAVYHAPLMNSSDAGHEQLADASEPRPVDESQPRTDRYGDPLPDGAIARLGTVRFRSLAGVGALRFRPDGKSVAVGGFETAGIMDCETGEERRIVFTTQTVRCLTLTQDGQTAAGCLADKTGPQRDRSTIQIWAVASGQLLRTIDFADPRNYPLAIAISPDGKRVAAASSNRTVRVFDVGTGEVLWQHEPRPYSYRCLAFSPEGKYFATSGPGDKDPSLYLYDAASGKRVREVCKCADATSPIFSADGKTFAAVTRLNQEEPNRLHVWDVETGKEYPLPEKQEGAAFEVALAPDGKTVAASQAKPNSRRQVLWGPLDIGVWDIASGKKTSQFPGGWHVAFSPDGRTVASSYGATTFLHDLATAKERNQKFDGHLSVLWSIAFAPDGKTIVTEDRHECRRVWDAETGRQLDRTVGRPTRGDRWTLSRDGKLMAWLDPSVDRDIHLCDATSGKELHLLKGDRKDLMWPVFAFSSDGKILTVVSYRSPPTMIYQWDVATGKELPPITDVPGNGFTNVAYSPNGKLLALGCRDGTVRLWQIAEGKEFRVFRSGVEKPRALAVAAIAFSLDGHALAANMDGTVRVFEVITAKERRRLTANANCLAFSPDGLTLVSENGDTTALVWDIAGARHRDKVSAADLDRAWADLASDDARAAYSGLGVFIAAKQDGIADLKKRLRFDAVDERRVLRGIDGLNSDRFGDREQATRDLEQMGELAEPALRRVLTQNSSLEVRRRVTNLLEKLDRSLLTGDALRTWRTIEILEGLGTPEARETLRMIARDSATARLKQEAQAALERLSQAEKAPPP